MPARAARDFAAVAGSINFDEFYSGDVRRHPEMRSRHISAKRGPVIATGVAVYLPHREPEVVHVSYWNPDHPLIEAA